MPPVPLFVALADPTRCRIIEILHGGPQPVHLLASSFKISRPAISRHLRVLKQARLISEKKTGRENLYALRKERLKPAAKWLGTLLPAPKPIAAPVAAEKPEIKTSAAHQPETKSAKKTAAPKREPLSVPQPPEPTPISQMGFDF